MSITRLVVPDGARELGCWQSTRRAPGPPHWSCRTTSRLRLLTSIWLAQWALIGKRPRPCTRSSRRACVVLLVVVLRRLRRRRTRQSAGDSAPAHLWWVRYTLQGSVGGWRVVRFSRWTSSGLGGLWLSNAEETELLQRHHVVLLPCVLLVAIRPVRPSVAILIRPAANPARRGLTFL